MLLLRLLGTLLLFLAFAALAYDGTHMLASPRGGLLLGSLSSYLQKLAPAALESLKEYFLGNAPAYLWNGLIEPMLVLPVCILFGVIGALFFFSGYRHPAPEIVSD
ncbi:MAG: hypothetical protein WBX25_00980 [Rhodomicrobium sp.]